MSSTDQNHIAVIPTSLPQVVEVDAEKCVNCHACIGACPVKHCNDGSGDHVTVNHDMCIACGQCVRACTHKARRIRDDSQAFFADLRSGTPIVVIVAPAVAAVFPGDFLRFNGWLTSLGVKAAFDVSFGAELTIKSYLDHVERNKPKAVIAQPCPALVSYIEIYRPELLPYLAPADSPMLHTAKMIGRFYPKYRDHRIAVMSPCGAKKREFVATGIGHYNVTFNECIAELQRSGRSLRDFTEVDYGNPPAERAVLFSTPGGLLRTAERWNPAVGSMTRKIEGPHTIYHYLDHLAESIAAGVNPLLIDCLNCEFGCNGGPGTPNQGASQDKLEHAVASRAAAMHKRYAQESGSTDPKKIHSRLMKLINAHWEPGLYQRTYTDRHANNATRLPTDAQRAEIFKRMEKKSEKDELNCGGCGYGTCREMAVAIYNGHNRPANCHLYHRHRMEKLIHDVEEMQRIADHSRQLAANMETMRASVSEIAKHAAESSTTASNGADAAVHSSEAVAALQRSSQSIGSLSRAIAKIAAQTRLLALNASIEAARAGEHGRGFAVVAAEVKNLAHSTAESADSIVKELQVVSADTANVGALVDKVRGLTASVQNIQQSISAATKEQDATVSAMATMVNDIAEEVAKRIRMLEDYASESKA